MDCRVKTTRDHDQIRFELSRNWEKKFFASMFIFIGSKKIVILFLPTKIDVVSSTFPFAHVSRVCRFTTWEEVQPVHRLQHDSIIVVENGLRSIALVDVPIED